MFVNHLLFYLFLPYRLFNKYWSFLFVGGSTLVTAIGVAVSIYQYVNCEYSATDNYKKCMGK